MYRPSSPMRPVSPNIPNRCPSPSAPHIPQGHSTSPRGDRTNSTNNYQDQWDMGRDQSQSNISGNRHAWLEQKKGCTCNKRHTLWIFFILIVLGIGGGAGYFAYPFLFTSGKKFSSLESLCSNDLGFNFDCTNTKALIAANIFNVDEIIQHLVDDTTITHTTLQRQLLLDNLDLVFEGTYVTGSLKNNGKIPVLKYRDGIRTKDRTSEYWEIYENLDWFLHEDGVPVTSYSTRLVDDRRCAYFYNDLNNAQRNQHHAQFTKQYMNDFNGILLDFNIYNGFNMRQEEYPVEYSYYGNGNRYVEVIMVAPIEPPMIRDLDELCDSFVFSRLYRDDVWGYWAQYSLAFLTDNATDFYEGEMITFVYHEFGNPPPSFSNNLLEDSKNLIEETRKENTNKLNIFTWDDPTTYHDFESILNDTAHGISADGMFFSKEQTAFTLSLQDWLDQVNFLKKQSNSNIVICNPTYDSTIILDLDNIALLTFTSYLLGKEKYGYYSITNQFFIKGYQKTWHFWDYWKFDYGLPLEDFHPRADYNWIYEREFENYLILVNPTTNTVASLNLLTDYVLFDESTVSVITISSRSGYILKKLS